MQDDYGNELPMQAAKTINARLDDGDARMARIEGELEANTKATEQIRVNTAELVEFFAAAQGAFRVLNWIGRVAKPITYIVMLASAGLAFWKALTLGGGGR